MYNRLENGAQLCMSVRQAEKWLQRKRTKVIYVYETVYLPPDFVERCRERQIQIIITR